MTDATQQPDPQVVACPWCGAAAGKPCQDPASGAPVAAYCGARLDHAARKPLTVADIPAGQGVASLFLMRSERWGGSFPVLFYRDENGHPRPIYRPGVGGYPEGVDALWEHLAATLHTVTAEETP